MKDNFRITFYEPWMKPQIAELFENEYGINKNDFENLMTKLYEHPIQLSKGIQLVALDEQKVIGFQSFFYWPYVLNHVVYSSFQSGNSLTHPDYRGKGIFKQLLNFVFENKDLIKADFFVGFPVQASYGSFIKNKWFNIFNLVWYVKLVNPIGFLFGNRSLLTNKDSFLPLSQNHMTGHYRLSESKEFYEWKHDLKFNKSNYFYFTHKISEEEEISFEMKFQVRKKIINEVIIGKIYFKGAVQHKLPEAIKAVLKFLRRSKCVTICSIAINEYFKAPDCKTILEGLNFKKINKEIYFIVKPVNGELEVQNPELWDIGRADIDTW